MYDFEALKATREALRELARVVRNTQQTLATMLEEAEQSTWLSPKRRSGQLADTLEHMEHVREGFILSQRTPSRATLAELRRLVQSMLIDWEWLQDLDWQLAPGDQIEILGQQLVVYNHALVALAVLPRLPAEVITFPQPRPTYGDVTVPALPSETLARIEEIEHMIYQAEIKPVNTLDYGPFRRTYAFFEASSWLVNRYLEPLLGDPEQ